MLKSSVMSKRATEVLKVGKHEYASEVMKLILGQESALVDYAVVAWNEVTNVVGLQALKLKDMICRTGHGHGLGFVGVLDDTEFFDKITLYPSGSFMPKEGDHSLCSELLLKRMEMLKTMVSSSRAMSSLSIYVSLFVVNGLRSPSVYNRLFDFS